MSNRPKQPSRPLTPKEKEVMERINKKLKETFYCSYYKRDVLGRECEYCDRSKKCDVWKAILA